jgi:hypothetical protein
MTEQELRAVVRAAIAQHIGPPPSAEAAAGWVPATFLRGHASHGQFELPALGTECIIEPSVTCNHCGYCKSYGH